MPPLELSVWIQPEVKVLHPCCWAAQGPGSFSYTESSLSSLLLSLQFVLTASFCLRDSSFPPNHKPLDKGNSFSGEPLPCWEGLSHWDWELPKREISFSSVGCLCTCLAIGGMPAWHSPLSGTDWVHPTEILWLSFFSILCPSQLLLPEIHCNK